MSQRLELSIEGKGNDGDILVVDGWPNFKTMPMPECIPVTKETTIYKPYPVDHVVPSAEGTTIVHERMIQAEPEKSGYGLFLWWLAMLTLLQVYQLFRNAERRKEDYRR